MQITLTQAEPQRHETERIAEIMLLPIFKLLAEAIGLDFVGLETYPMMDHRMAEPCPNDGLTIDYKKTGFWRQAIWRVQREHAYSVYEPDLAPLYPVVPLVKYFIAGGAGPNSVHLCTKLATDGIGRELVGFSNANFVAMGYLVFSCSIGQDGALKISGPSVSATRIDGGGWPDPEEPAEYLGKTSAG